MRAFPVVLFVVAGVACGPKTGSGPLATVAPGDEKAASARSEPVQDVGAPSQPAAGTRSEQRDPDPEPVRDPVPILVPPPPWAHTVASPLQGQAVPQKLKLTVLSKERNRVTDNDAWFEEVRWEPPVVAGYAKSESQMIPNWLPGIYAGEKIFSAVRAPRSKGHIIATFGEYPEHARLVVVFDADGAVVSALDLSNYGLAPKVKPGDRQFVDQELFWADLDGDTLFLAHGHRTYAESSGGQNAYITALDVKTGELKWRSDPLIANAGTFVVTDHHVIAGYGFTAEPDFVYVLRRVDGTVQSRVKVKSGPSYIFLRDDRLFVRTYDTNYVFRVEGLAR